MADLPDTLLETFTLAQFQRMKYRDIAEILDIPVGTVKSRVAAAEKLLREALRRQWSDLA